MSLKANIEISINLNCIKVCKLMRQGYLKYKISLHFIDKQKNKNYCHPYNILTKNDLKINEDLNKINAKQSEIDTNSQYWLSSPIFVKYQDSCYNISQTCFFKTYIDIDIIDNVSLICSAILLFSEQKQSVYLTINSYQSQIFKIYDISTYLPIVFDDFGGLQICGTYSAAIIEFKFQNEEFQQQMSNYDDFGSYVQYVTQGLTFVKTRNFYNYFRGIIQRQYISLQKRIKKYQKFVQKKKAKQSLVNNKKFVQSNMNFIVQLQPNIDLLSQIQRLSTAKYQNMQQFHKSIIDLILKDFTEMKAQVYYLWNCLNQYIFTHSQIITKKLKQYYDELVRDKFKNNIFSHILKNHDFTCTKYSDSAQIHIQYSKKQKLKYQANQQILKQNFPIQDRKFLGNDSTNTKIFQEIVFMHQKTKLSFNNLPTNLLLPNYQLIFQKTLFKQKKHVIILVHGFNASRLDFIPIKNCLEIYYSARIIISISNQGRTSDSLDIMGKRLAIQVLQQLNKNNDYRISFIGHSMGGLIIRSAIPHLKSIQHLLYSYISLCTPHLGYLYQASKLTQAGLWAIKKFDKCDSISQLCFCDQQQIKNCFLYKLSIMGSLNQFKKLLFVSSSQDEYVPFESARIQKNQSIFKGLCNQSNISTICEMVDSIFKNIKAEQISRMNVIFQINSDFSSIIGKTGHILFLSDTQFIKQFVACFGKFLQ